MFVALLTATRSEKAAFTCVKPSACAPSRVGAVMSGTTRSSALELVRLLSGFATTTLNRALSSLNGAESSV